MGHKEILLSIKTTLVYFDQFSYPLTAEELYVFLWQPLEKIQWTEFLELLDFSVTEKVCARVWSYYMLPGREECAEIRRTNVLLVESKLALARRAAKFLGVVPFVRGIFVCNTVAAGWPTSESDIDVLIIVQTGRLWLSRLLVTMVASLFNFRRGKKQIADRICLSFYLTHTHLNLDSVRISKPDIYLTYWLHQLVPIFDEQNFLVELQSANNWTDEYLPNARRAIIPHPDKIVVLNRMNNFFKKSIELLLRSRIGDWLENVCRRYQRTRIDNQPHRAEPGVVISDAMLKFHEDDRREEYQQVWLTHPANQDNV